MFVLKTELTKLSALKCSVRFGWGLVCHMVSITQPEREKERESKRSRELRLLFGRLIHRWHSLQSLASVSMWSFFLISHHQKILSKHMSIEQTSCGRDILLWVSNRQVELNLGLKVYKISYSSFVWPPSGMSVKNKIYYTCLFWSCV